MSFVTLLLIFAVIQFILAIILAWLNFGPKFSSWDKIRPFLSKAIAILFILNLSLVIYSYGTGVRLEIWIPLTASLVGALMLCSFMKKSTKLIPVFALLVPVLVVFVSLSVNGPAPITQDEGLWSGLSYRIIQDRGWNATSYSADLPAYYQILPLTSYLQASISIVTGMDVFSLVSPLTVLLLALISSFCIYIILKNLVRKKDSKFELLGPAFLCSAPYLLSVGFFPQYLAIAFFLLSLSILTMHMPEKSAYKECLIGFILLSIVGTITHVTYPIFLLFTVLAILLAYRKLTNRIFEANFLKSALLFAAFFTVMYWGYSQILASLVINYGKGWIESLTDLILGGAAPFESGRRIWYDLGPSTLTYSFALLPALAGAYVFVEVVPNLRSFSRVKNIFGKMRQNYLFTLGITGLLLLALAFITRASSGLSFTRYLGPGYLLLIPPSIGIVHKITRKKQLLGTILLVIILSTSVFFAIQDPSISPDIHRMIGLADKRSWNVAETLVQYKTDGLNYITDQRVGIPFFAMIIRYASDPSAIDVNDTLTSGTLIVLNLDTYGEVWANRFLPESTLQSIDNGTYSQIYTDGMYTMHVAD